MPANRKGANPQRHRIQFCEVFWRPKTPDDEIAIFFHVDGQLIRSGIIRAQSRLTGNDDNISPSSVAIQIESNARVLRDMRQPFRIGAAIDEEGRGGFIPPEPHGCGLWRSLRINGGQPDETLIAQAACHALAKGRRRVWKLKRHRLSSAFSRYIVLSIQRSLTCKYRPTSLLSSYVITH